MGWLDDYANRVSQLMLQQGNARAQGQAQSGQIWGNAINQIGQIGAAIPQQLQQQRAQQQEQQLRQMQLDQQQRALNDAAALDKAYPSLVGQDGSLNIDGISKSGLPGHLIPTVLKSASEYNKSLLDNKELIGKIQKLQDEHKAGLAESAGLLALGVQQAGYSPDAMRTAVQSAQQAGLLTPQEAQQVSQMPMEQMKGVIDRLVAGSAKAQAALKDAAQGREATARIPGIEAQNRMNALVAANMSPSGLTPGEQQQAQLERDRMAQSQRQWEQDFGVRKQELGLRQATNAREQDKFNATYGAGITENGQPIPVSEAAKAQAEYRVPPPNPRSAGYQARMAEILRVNPDYDATNYAARNAMRTKYTSGEQGNTIVAMNTAIGHLDQLASAMKALNSGDAQAVNTAKNYFKTQFGSPDATNYQAIKTFLDGELAAIAKKGVASDAEIAQMKELAKAASSPAQIQGFIDTAIPLIGSKLAALDYQYHQTMGDKDPFNALSPTSQQILSGRGFDPKHPTVKGGGQDASPSGLVPATSPPPDFSGNWRWDGQKWVKK